jgi:hypothetical protein
MLLNLFHLFLTALVPAATSTAPPTIILRRILLQIPRRLCMSLRARIMFCFFRMIFPLVIADKYSAYLISAE